MLSQVVYGRDNLKLITVGIPIDESTLHRLKAGDVESVMVEKADFAKLNSEVLRDTPNIRICRDCDTELPLKEAAEDELAIAWVCMKCHAKHRGSLDIDASKHLIDRIGMGEFPVNRSRLLHASYTVAKSVDTLVSNRYSAHERRASPRMADAVRPWVRKVVSAMPPGLTALPEPL